MKLYRLHALQTLPVSVEEAWSFFSSPANLSKITPPALHLVVEGEMQVEMQVEMYPGMILTYRVHPFPGIRSRWVTEITHVRVPEYFVDEQRMGPYRFWHHQHHFRPEGDGVNVEDIVHYALPWDPLSRPVHCFLVKSRLNAIFRYREERLNRIFGSRNEKE